MRNNTEYRKPFKAKRIFFPIIIDVVSEMYYSISLLFNLQFPVFFLFLIYLRFIFIIIIVFLGCLRLYTIIKSISLNNNALLLPLALILSTRAPSLVAVAALKRRKSEI
jgi:hypothetical protein